MVITTTERVLFYGPDDRLEVIGLPDHPAEDPRPTGDLMPLTPPELERMHQRLREKAEDRFKHMVYCGRGVVIADVERWLRDALEAKDRLENWLSELQDPAL